MPLRSINRRATSSVVNLIHTEYPIVGLVVKLTLIFNIGGISINIVFFSYIFLFVTFFPPLVRSPQQSNGPDIPSLNFSTSVL